MRMYLVELARVISPDPARDRCHQAILAGGQHLCRNGPFDMKSALPAGDRLMRDLCLVGYHRRNLDIRYQLA